MTVSDDMFKSFVALPRALLRQQFDQSIRNLEKSDGIQHIPIKLIEKHTTPKFTESWEIRKIKSNNICGLFGRWRNPNKKKAILPDSLEEGESRQDSLNIVCVGFLWGCLFFLKGGWFFCFWRLCFILSKECTPLFTGIKIVLSFSRRKLAKGMSCCPHRMPWPLKVQLLTEEYLAR